MNNSTNSSRADPTFYLTTQLATGIVLTILSPVTVISNALLLFTIFKDPLKCFRTPPTYFIVALAFVDLITGIFIEPFFIMARLVRYITWTIRLVNEPYKSLWFFGGMFSYVGLNASFLLVLGLIVSQFIAITYPHRYRAIVTTRRVLACVILSCVYFTGFILLQYVGVPLSTLYKVDLHLHSTLITVLLISSSLLLLISFHKFAETSRSTHHNAKLRNSIRARSTREQESAQQNQPKAIYHCNFNSIRNSHCMLSSSYRVSSSPFLHETRDATRAS